MPLTPPTEQQSRIIWFVLTSLAIAALVIVMAAAVWGLGKLVALLGPVLWPLAIAAVVACLLTPIVDILETRKFRRSRAILLVFVFAFGVVFAILGSIVPQVIDETQQLVAKVPEYTTRLQDRINDFLAHPPALLRHFEPKPPAEPGAQGAPPNPLLASATDWVKAHLPAVGAWVLKQLAKLVSGFGLLVGLVLVPVYAYYFLLEKRTIQRRWREYIPARDFGARNEVIFLCESISQYLVAFFRGQLLVAICDAVLYTIGFLAVGLNYAFLLGLLAVVLTMVPFIGAIIICVSALLLAFVQFGDWQRPLMVLLVFAVVQTLESVLISPKIMGNRVGLHPLIIIVAVMTGTTVFGGILGGILAIPLAAALRVILGRYVWNRS